MKHQFIYKKKWTEFTDLPASAPENDWYISFINNQLMPLIQNSEFLKETSSSVKEETALSLAAYLHDAVAQSGGWKRFTDRHQALYGRPLPFYHLTETYLPDEINREDIALICWLSGKYTETDDFNTPTPCPDPFQPQLLEFSQQVYELMDSVFEEAPFSDEETISDWVMWMEILEMPPFSLPNMKQETDLTEDVRRCLEYSGGHPLLFFETYHELIRFLTDVLGWSSSPYEPIFPEWRNKSHFIIYPNSKGLLLADSVAWYFCDPKNPYYDAKKAREKGWRMFTTLFSCPIDLLYYGMFNGLLPDVELPFPKGKETLQENWDFIMRLFLPDAFYDEYDKSTNSYCDTYSDDEYE